MRRRLSNITAAKLGVLMRLEIYGFAKTPRAGLKPLFGYSPGCIGMYCIILILPGSIL